MARPLWLALLAFSSVFAADRFQISSNAAPIDGPEITFQETRHDGTIEIMTDEASQPKIEVPYEFQ